MVNRNASRYKRQIHLLIVMTIFCVKDSGPLSNDSDWDDGRNLEMSKLSEVLGAGVTSVYNVEVKKFQIL